MSVKLSGAQVFRIQPGLETLSSLRWRLGEKVQIISGAGKVDFSEIFLSSLFTGLLKRAPGGLPGLCFSKESFVALGRLSLLTDRFRVSSV